MNIQPSPRLIGAAVLGLALSLSGCANSRTANYYSPSEAMNEAKVRAGTVEAARPVKIRPDDSELGSLIGAVIGGIAASGNIGKGNGAVVSGVLGATVGGAVGNAVGKDVNTKDGLELVLKLDNGEVIAVVQEADISFAVGQKVRVITRGRVSRVVPAI
ncbi:hypothetical protein FNU76_19505 [Chitinimonas arctica]|uniref:Glycine zipper 2TM domain-containing protein n=1 Tax=Chitinimonas arctica TaxID=2594795 RepID=A0A516SJM5_9NEIS|nr:hypothetical protein [Chitinimonas arctica]QDQ28361.1 hypothetical protein FNU76_19505 [Chitinimonas arctica]